MSSSLSADISLADFNAGMNADQIFNWLSVQLNRTPESYDLYRAGSVLYESGVYAGAAKVLQLYVDGNGSETPGNHLLGYAYYMTGAYREAVAQLKQCVNAGFDSDWQLLVELQTQLAREDEAAERGMTVDELDAQNIGAAQEDALHAALHDGGADLADAGGTRPGSRASHQGSRPQSRAFATVPTIHGNQEYDS